jgi:hypothetical protein
MPSKVYLRYHQTIVTELGRLKHAEAMRQNAYIDARLEGAGPREAAKEAGYTGRSVRTPVKLIETSELRAQFQAKALERGLTLDKVVDKLSEHLEARALQTLQGKEVSLSDAPDYKVQGKALDTLTDLMGMKDAQKVQAGGSSLTIQLPEAVAARLAQRIIEGNS